MPSRPEAASPLTLGPDDPVPLPVRRVAVAGVSGSGKTTLARRIGQILAIDHVEIDALYHGPAWTPRPEFEDDVRAFVARDAWVTEWQHRSVRPLLTARADLVVWLDLPTRVVMRQVVVRTVRRRLSREVLWNGNLEQPLLTVLHDREHIVRWAWQSRHAHRDLPQRLASVRPDLPVVRLRSRTQVRRWLERLEAGADGAGRAVRGPG
jgi:adenylate kinase family enzyme